ncbi:MAG: hypothetical protein CFE44_14845 [Burkholderiales bacterium PBB4]|nr:MAG: hypothetical protein CFE44_14845 [Burkholderiales bacterium PBB4]
MTISGKVGFGFGKSASQTDSNGNAGSGMQLYDGDVNFTANEDLGGGWRAIASTEVQLRGRSDQAAAASTNASQFRPRNATIALVTPIGVFSGGAIESPSGFFRATSYKDFLNTGFDSANGPWDGKANIDFVRYMVPVAAVPGLNLSVWYTEVGSGIGNSFVSGVSTKITAPVLMANYAAGPVSAYFDYTPFSAQKTVGAPVQAVLDGLTRYRIGGDYDFGLAKVFIGYQTRDRLPDQYALGLTVPLGATTVNLTYGARDAAKADAKYGVAADVERTGTALQVQYNFSKQTLAEVSYETYTGGAKIVNGERDLSDGYRITLRKYF